MGSGSESTETTTIADNNNTATDVIVNDTVTTEQSNALKVGSTVSDRQLKITYKSCDTDFQNYSYYADVKDGYKIIEAIFDFENICDTDAYISGFECYADGSKCETFYYVDDYTFPYDSISSGRKLTDVAVYYEVPADSESIEIEYESNFWTDDKYIFIVE